MRLLCSILALGLALGACGGAQVDPDEPQTAREKQLEDAKARGEVDGSDGSTWGAWRYQGDRSDCFYVVGRRCFKSKKTACASACRVPRATVSVASMCTIDGGGPAAVTCNKK
jgi:hypothetical protein